MADSIKTINTETVGGRLRRILELWRDYPPMTQLVQSLANQQKLVTITGLSGSAPSLALAELARQTDQPILAVTGKAEEAADLYDDLAFLLDPQTVAHFPARQILPYDFRSPVAEIIGQRISALASLQENRTRIIVAPIRALLEPTIPRDLLRSSSIDLEVGQDADVDLLLETLVTLGFRRVPLVEEVGDFAKRGGLVDLFTPDSDVPVRIEFFGDTVETIRQFDVSSQRTIGQLKRVTILPKREIPITQETLETYLERLPDDDADYLRARYLNDPELPGLEWLAALFGIKQGSFFEYFPASGIVYLEGAATLRQETEDILAEAGQLRDRLTARLTTLPEPTEYYHRPEDLFATIESHALIERIPFRGGRHDIISFECGPHPAFASRLDMLAEAIREYNTIGIRHIIVTDNAGQASRLAELITEKTNLSVSPGVEVANLKGGFLCNPGGFAILTDHEIFSRYHRRVRKKKFREGVAISDYANLNRGDYVVHTDYGIARYLGLETLVIDNRSRDCLYLQYAEKDRLYVPIEEFNRVAKYSGKDTAPELTRLGGPGWDRLKERTKKAIADMAKELIHLYAMRKSEKATAFGEDSIFLKQLEASFPFEETPDQEKAINDVKRDLQIEKPMDRLVCGDVGYGKTEVAIRAAFKAIDGGKQVAVLVPTTILAQQHFTTFSARFADFPVRLAMMSRFRSKKEQLETAIKLASGDIDIVVGTHRLLSDDIRFRDLGLLIIDEEHRFGVRHKEKLRQMKSNVHTLAMTATPIPRTLQMSLMGARDMSLINTSPKDRLPIITEIVEFDPGMIATAILREVDRGGQVFFVHNRVQTIEAMHHFLHKTLPQIKIAVAHGQMHERSLEGIMLAFMAKQFDVLLCTSIIESGLDIPSANTIIINRADRFGLAQLYQIRGRVGRSARRAYAYLMTPPIKMLNADAVKRLRALEAHSDLGSGFALAMRDLEIRGAGELLGARQSGYIEEVGYDLYNKLLEEAVAELKGHPLERPPDTKLELDIEIFLPDAYVTDRQQKVDIYRRLADATQLEQVDKIREEVIDRFGRPPQSSVFLFDATAVKIAASKLQVQKVKLKDGQVNLFFEEGKKLTRPEVEAIRRATDQPMEFSLFEHPRISIDLRKVREEDRLPHLRGVLSKVG